jgi:hypothetical protein
MSNIAAIAGALQVLRQANAMTITKIIARIEARADAEQVTADRLAEFDRDTEDRHKYAASILRDLARELREEVERPSAWADNVGRTLDGPEIVRRARDQLAEHEAERRQDARITALEAGLREALDEWANTIGDHGDEKDEQDEASLARLRALLGER